MRTIFNELYFASTEKCILSGYAGFGVRTYSRALQADEASQIARECKLSYHVDTEKMVTKAQLQANPDCVADFPPVYFYREVTLTGGKTVYCIGRIVYVGIDYGYFAGIDSATRSGSNYFAHVAVCDHRPDFSAIARLVRSDFFRPHCLSASSDNAEYKVLLTGEPTLLSPREVEIDALPANNAAHAKASGQSKGLVATALLQRYANLQAGTESDLTRLIIVAPKKETCGIIAFIGTLPKELTCGLTFQTRYTDGYGVPQELCCVMADEENTAQLYYSNHITANLIDHTSENIPADNYIYQKIKELYASGKDALAEKVMAYYMSLNLKESHDYEFLYKLYVSTLDEGSIDLSDITTDFYDKTAAAGISAEGKEKLFSQINAAISDGLLSTSGNTTKAAIQALVATRARHADRLAIDEKATIRLTQMLFGRTSYISRLADSNNIATLLAVAKREYVESEDVLLGSLQTTDNADVWTAVLKFYYGTTLAQHHQEVTDAVMGSHLHQESIGRVLKELFPTSSHKAMWRQYLLNNQSQAARLPSILADITACYMPDFVIEMVSSSGSNAQTIGAIGQPTRQYLADAMNSDADRACQMLLKIADSIGTAEAESLRLAEPLSAYADRLYASSAISAVSTNLIDSILRSRIIDGNWTLRHRFETLRSIAKAEPLTHIDRPGMLLVARLGNVGDDYVRQTFAQWLCSAVPSPAEIAATMKQSRRLAGPMAGQLLAEAWQCKAPQIAKEKEKYADTIIDSSSLSGKQWSNFASRCKDRSLADHITASNKWLKRIIRKIIEKYFPII